MARVKIEDVIGDLSARRREFWSMQLLILPPEQRMADLVFCIAASFAMMDGCNGPFVSTDTRAKCGTSLQMQSLIHQPDKPTLIT